jgi:hypothetical protein
MTRRFFAALLAALALSLAAASGAAANHSSTELVSFGPAGGNGATAGVFRGSSTDGTRVFFQTSEPLVAADTDASIDLYERSNATTTLLTTGPSGGNAASSATWVANSQDGTRVFFRTAEKLVSGDTDSAADIYERSNGATTLISTGPAGGNANLPAVFAAISKDGTHVFFQTAEALEAADTDAFTDIYERFAGTTTRVSTGPSGGNDDLPAFFDGVTPDGSHVYFHTDEALAPLTDLDTMQDLYQRFAGTTTHLSYGPAGGSGNADFDYDAFFDGVSADGSKVWLHTDEVLTFDDTDTAFDVYERSGATIALVSTGPAGGNAELGAFFDAASQDGSRVFFDTQESLTGGDGDGSYDVYQRAGGTTTLMTTGPAGGNGTFYSAFAGISADGTHLFFSTPESLVAGDTDAFQDVYDRSGGQTTLMSVGPDGGNGDNPANFSGASKDGARLFFSTDEALLATDTDLYPDIYERFSGQTTRISTGANGGTGDFFASWAGASEDGTRVFFETDESLISTDTDAANDVYQASVVGGYPRPKGATPLYASLVPAFAPCTAPNRVHAPPLAAGSCNPPSLASSQLTMGTPDANGKVANGVGFVKLNSIAGVASTPADEADVKFTVSLSDVRRQSDLGDYAGELQARPSLRITDRVSGSIPIDPGTLGDLTFNVTVPCTPTVDTTIGSTCATTTTADSVLPGTVREIKRTVWQVGQIQVWDGGPDGLAVTPGNTLFAVQGIMAP